MNSGRFESETPESRGSRTGRDSAFFWQLGLLLAIAIACALIGFGPPAVSLRAVDRFDHAPWFMIGVIARIMGFLSMGLASLGIFGLFSGEHPRRAILIIVPACAFFLLWVALGQVARQTVLQVSGELNRAMAPLVSAIRAYAREQGRPPNELADLVPRYLPRIPEVPRGLPARLEYHVVDSSRVVGRQVWFDLGPQGSAGDTTRAFLTFEIDLRNRVIASHLEDFPRGVIDSPFASTVWRDSVSRRGPMRIAVMRCFGRGADAESLFAALGPPVRENRRNLDFEPWWLRVPVGRGSGFINSTRAAELDRMGIPRWRYGDWWIFDHFLH